MDRRQSSTTGLLSVVATRLGASRFLDSSARILSVLGFFLAGLSTELAVAARPSLPLQHAPLQPKSGEAVTVTAQFETAAQGAMLQFQVVEPGRYIRRNDASYKNGWREIPMRDDGLSGDAKAGDGIYSAVVPGDFQKHRRLVRYRVVATNASGVTIQLPTATNDCPNGAWFVFDGFHEWSGASQPGTTPAKTFSPEFFSTLPALILIARKGDAEASQWDGSANRRPFFGTLVSEGVVYDHILFHNRGQASTYVAGKNKWGFKFVPGNEFQARDAWGRPYKHKWSSLDMNGCASAWAPVNRGMVGMDEAVSYRAYELAGVPASDTAWVQFRIVESSQEAPANDQYAGDLRGLYLIVQEKNGAWLKENHLQDGNIYSAESGVKHEAKAAAPNRMDFGAFRNACERGQTEAWWRAHLNLPDYYSFHALNRLLANIDLRPYGNHYMYHGPDGKWIVMPHDLDMMFIPKTHQPGEVAQARCLDVPALALEYKNRAREILDLLCEDGSPQGGQIGQLTAEMSQMICPPGQPRNWAELDEAIWNWNPRSNQQGAFYASPYPDHRFGGGWVRTLAAPNFAGECRYITDFCTDSRPSRHYAPNDGDQRGYGYGYLAFEAHDPKTPARPTIRYAGVTNYLADGLSFEAGNFSTPQGAAASAAAIQWRVAEISAPGLEGFEAGKPWKYEIQPGWTSGEASPDSKTVKIPSGICQPGHTYRARMRYKDSTERWSHWSAAAQFVAR